MDKHNHYRALEAAFVSTFLEELIPGIIHNFANPLNGIMGRGQIMRRRFDQLAARFEQSSPQSTLEQMEIFKKLSADINEINSECDRFYNMFQDVSWKFYSLSNHDSGKFSLYQLLATELRFAEYYLNFKHQVKKEIQLEESIPPVSGDYANCALSIWALLRQAMLDMNGLWNKTLLIKTIRKKHSVKVYFEYPVPPLNRQDETPAGTGAPEYGAAVGNPNENLLPLADSLLRTMDAKVEIEEEGERRRLIVELSH